MTLRRQAWRCQTQRRRLSSITAFTVRKADWPWWTTCPSWVL